MRDADLPPTPGSFVSSLIKFASGGAVMVVRLLSYLVAEQLRNSATQQPKTTPESSCLPSSRLTALASPHRLFGRLHSLLRRRGPATSRRRSGRLLPYRL